MDASFGEMLKLAGVDRSTVATIADLRDGTFGVSAKCRVDCGKRGCDHPVRYFLKSANSCWRFIEGGCGGPDFAGGASYLDMACVPLVCDIPSSAWKAVRAELEPQNALFVAMSAADMFMPAVNGGVRTWDNDDTIVPWAWLPPGSVSELDDAFTLRWHMRKTSADEDFTHYSTKPTHRFSRYIGINKAVKPLVLGLSDEQCDEIAGIPSIRKEDRLACARSFVLIHENVDNIDFYHSDLANAGAFAALGPIHVRCVSVAKTVRTCGYSDKCRRSYTVHPGVTAIVEIDERPRASTRELRGVLMSIMRSGYDLVPDRVILAWPGCGNPYVLHRNQPFPSLSKLT